MSKKKKTAIGLAVLAALAALGFAATAKAADDDEDDDKDKPWGGPDPGKPGKKPGKKPEAPSKRPSSIEPWTLWISPDCDDLMIGPDWWEETARPAIKEWIASGYGAPAEFFDGDTKAIVNEGRDAVVRGILGPYSPLCIDAYPWMDMYEVKNPKPIWDPPDGGPEFNAWHAEIIGRMEQWANDYPALIALMQELQHEVFEAWAEENP